MFEGKSDTDVKADSDVASRRFSSGVMVRYIFLPFLALPASILGIALLFLPGLLLDRRTYGENNDDSGTLILLFFYLGAFLGWAWGCVAIGNRILPKTVGQTGQYVGLQRWGVLWAPISVVVYFVTFVPALSGRLGYLPLLAAGGSVVFGLLAIKFFLSGSTGRASLALGLGSVVVLGSLVAGPLKASINASKYEVAGYKDAGTSLGFVNEDRLGAELPGWAFERHEKSPHRAHRHGYAYVIDPDGNEIEIQMSPFGGGCDEAIGETCVWLEPLEDGSKVVAAFRDCDGERQLDEVRALKGGSSWVVEPGEYCAENPPSTTAEELRLLLTTIDPTTAEIWVETVPDG